MTVNLQSYKVAAGEKPASSTKQNNMIQATEDALNDIDPAAISGFPNDASQFLDGSGSWSTPASPAVTDWASVAGTFTYSSADAPTYVMSTPSNLSGTIQVGSKIKVTQTTDKFFVATAVGATTITMYGGTDYSLLNSTITAVAYSSRRAPFGFPLAPDKWTVATTSTSDATQTNPTSGTWYNPGSNSITIPIGVWDVYYEGHLKALFSAGGGSITIAGTLSTGASSESDTQLSCYLHTGNTGGTASRMGVSVYRRKFLTLASKTQYFLNAKVNDSSGSAVGWYGSSAGATIIRAVCAYI